MDKLKFEFAEPEHKVIPIPMSQERWLELAARQNVLRTAAGQAIWPGWKIDEVYFETRR